MKIKCSNSVFCMSYKNKPVETINSGDTITFETYDCFNNQIQNESHLLGELNWDLINPATGPVYVQDAKAGDILKVEIVDIKIADKGVMVTIPNLGPIGEDTTKEKTKIVPIRDGKAIFNDKIHIPINPMIGVIGTAPKEEEIPTGTPKEHGGNMDCKRIVKGAILYLPINVDGALLAIGDLHAVMGDGETGCCGVEIPGEATVKVEVIKGKDLPLPMLIEGKDIITIASAETLDEASVIATKNMHKFLIDNLKIEANEATMLLSIIGDLRICQIVDPLKTARMELPLWVVEKYNYNID
ncbi:acetamidase/formamidase family protein [Gottschalkia purinilytica]|uniref:Acetamidase/formamidase family protein n=1 Tax=Gottschalkia purinilytica TaxID=1503 RepID=A0A0L0WAD5_GOTPU|nr:acetamidase/formamidase family protein [Gottschalkia purinilytica]KNF08285.1 acetamidase/formamidase family protein [Gottschalkia purinilytica]